MTRLLAISILLVPLLMPQVAEARARARRPAKAKIRPKLLLTVEKVERVETTKPAPRILAAVGVALNNALVAEPLVITALGLKKRTAARTAWELRRRRLRWFGLTMRLESVRHKVVAKGKQKLLTAEVTVSLSGTRKERRRKGTFTVKATEKISIPVSVILQGEVLAARIAAARAAVIQALTRAVKKLTKK
jgi:hypothetical protein